MHVEVKRLETGELELFRQLIFVFEEVFEMKEFRIPGSQHLQSILEKPGFMVFVVLADQKVVGGLTAHTLTSYYYEAGDVYIYDLAVKTEFQRKGLGRALISALKKYCKESGINEIFVQADAPDEHALKFYEATGGTAEQVVHYTYEL